MGNESRWGVFEERSDDGRLIALHVVPVVCLDMDNNLAEVSSMHTLTIGCPCHPLRSGINQHAHCPILSHNDPEELGMSEAEWMALASAVTSGSLPN